MQHITYSETIYLFADKILSDRSRFINYDSHPSGEKLPVIKLSHEMVMGAVVYLLKKKMIELAIKDTKKFFVFPGKDVFAKKIGNKGTDVTGIEEKLFHNMEDEVKLSQAVYNLLPEDESSPWGQVVNVSKKSLVDKKLLQIETKAKLFFTKKYLYVPEAVSQYIPYFNEVKQDVSRFYEDKQLYKFVLAAIKSGIAKRKEQSTSDD